MSSSCCTRTMESNYVPYKKQKKNMRKRNTIFIVSIKRERKMGWNTKGSLCTGSELVSFFVSWNNRRITSPKDAYYNTREETHVHYKDTLIAIGMRSFVYWSCSFFAVIALFIQLSEKANKISLRSKNGKTMEPWLREFSPWKIVIITLTILEEIDKRIEWREVNDSVAIGTRFTPRTVVIFHNYWVSRCNVFLRKQIA